MGNAKRTIVCKEQSYGSHIEGIGASERSAIVIRLLLLLRWLLHRSEWLLLLLLLHHRRESSSSSHIVELRLLGVHLGRRVSAKVQSLREISRKLCEWVAIILLLWRLVLLWQWRELLLLLWVGNGWLSRWLLWWALRSSIRREIERIHIILSNRAAVYRRSLVLDRQ